MNKLRKSPFNFILVLLLVFANSGVASETNNHGHDLGTHHSNSLGVDAHYSDHSSLGHSMHAAGSMVDIDTGAINQGAETDSDDCACDELCCVSSLNVLDSSTAANALPADLNSLFTRPAYQSVTLSLPVPPPTA